MQPSYINSFKSMKRKKFKFVNQISIFLKDHLLEMLRFHQMPTWLSEFWWDFNISKGWTFSKIDILIPKRTGGSQKGLGGLGSLPTHRHVLKYRILYSIFEHMSRNRQVNYQMHLVWMVSELMNQTISHQPHQVTLRESSTQHLTHIVTTHFALAFALSQLDLPSFFLT